jgi:S1-C subfamily serine protease
MNENPTPDEPQPATGPDPLDDTQRMDVPRYAPAPDPRPDARWAWASPSGQPTSERWYEPGTAGSPPPYGAGPAYGPQPGYGPQPSFGAAPQPGYGTGPGWGQPSSGLGTPPPPAFGTPVTPVQPSRKRGGGAGAGTVVVASVLSAVLAAGGTVAVLEGTGAFDRPAPTTITNTAVPTTGQQPVTIDESSAVIGAAEKVGPAVVKITVEGAAADPFTGGSTEGIGSGFIYDANGWILTNRHVVSDATGLTVELKDGRRFDGRVYGIDTLTDLAIVKIDATGLPVAQLGTSDGLKIGQLVVAIGSPLGTYSFSVTSGIVSGKGRDIVVDNGNRINNLIQTDAAINPGNSGGPLADASGSVVGINTAVATSSSGIGFAIPIDIAKPIMAQAVKGEALNRPWIGIRFTSINLQVKKDQNLTVDNGALVTNTNGNGSAVVADSPAAKAGIKDGDIILSIDGTRIDQEHPLDALLVQFAPETSVTLDVLRDGQSLKVTVVLGTRPSNL